MPFIALILLLTVSTMGLASKTPTKAVSGQIKAIAEPVLKDKYTNSDYVRAIYLAEGGAKAQYPYGIRSVYCDSRLQCQRSCEKTVQNNRIRFARYGHKRFKTYLEFLGSRYCPATGRTLTQAELTINKTWIGNVKWFLEHPQAA